ncbi:MAG: phage baseplate assembly protein V [Neisseria sp.]|nr:phage baseplate assembly protein V [Neisseria sp.]
MNSGEIQRMIANLIKEGTVAESNPAGLVRVRHGGLTTDWLPYFVPAAGGVSVHRAPSVGERCLLLSPSGETANGMVLCGLASSQFPAPSASPDETVVAFPDGARVEYNHASGAMRISGIKTGTVEAAESLTFDTPQAVFTGNVQVQQTATVQGLFTYQAGMSGTGGGAGTSISGTISHTGEFANTGSLSSNGVVLSEHTHPDTTSGGNTGAPN